MNNTVKFLDAVSNDLALGFDLSDMLLPKAFVEKMLVTNERLARESAREQEMEENVCRMIASGMTAEEISLVLKIRVEEVRIIENNNTGRKIPEYTRTYKSRVKSRERASRSKIPGILLEP